MTLEEAREGIGRKVIYAVTPWDGRGDMVAYPIVRAVRGTR